jgi:hypothetical protein
MCACVPQHPWLFIFSSRGHDRQSSDQSFSSRGYDWQSSEQNNRKLISLHNNGEDDKHAQRFADFVGNIFRLETCTNSLVKVPPYSKLNFQGKIFFTQNWCNITLKDVNFIDSFISNDIWFSNLLYLMLLMVVMKLEYLFNLK